MAPRCGPVLPESPAPARSLPHTRAHRRKAPVALRFVSSVAPKHRLLGAYRRHQQPASIPGMPRTGDHPQHFRGQRKQKLGRTLMWFSTAGRVPRILHACAVGAGLAMFTADAQSQSTADKYPDKPIKIIVPFAPGGSADILSRVVGNKLTESFGQTIVVETRPGAGTVIGTTAAAKAEPDGYTLLMTVSNLATNQTLVPNLGYDAVRDFEPVSLLARAPVTIDIDPNFPPTNIKELIAAAKAWPGALNFGSAGPASMQHLTAEELENHDRIAMAPPVSARGAAA